LEGGRMTVLAVDPSSKSSGWCLVSDDGKVIDYGVVRATRIGLMAERIAAEVCSLWIDHPPFQLAIERATPQTRRGVYTDSWGPGIAAGVWLQVLQGYSNSNADPLLVKPSEWRRAMLPKGIKGRDAYKAAALQRANAEIGASGLPGPIETNQKGWDDMADAICLGVYAARRAKR